MSSFLGACELGIVFLSLNFILNLNSLSRIFSKILNLYNPGCLVFVSKEIHILRHKASISVNPECEAYLKSSNIKVSINFQRYATKNQIKNQSLYQ